MLPDSARGLINPGEVTSLPGKGAKWPEFEDVVVWDDIASAWGSDEGDA